jgi:nucleoside-diphosphate-sugar epimerase
LTGDRVLLVTGGSGSIGCDVLPRLSESGAFARILSLSRAPPRARTEENVTPLLGDVTLPGLGLDETTRCDLEGEVTDVLHAAADTRFGRPLDEARRVNADGTRNVLDLAERCTRLEQVLHLSTAYVCGLTEGRISERLLPQPPSFANTYQRSKHEAEDAVGQRMDALPVRIVRVSTPVGRSDDGSVPRLNHVHGLLRLLQPRLSPVMAVDPESPVDLVASDWVTDALVALVVQPRGLPRVVHLCEGEEALTLGTLLDETARAHAEHGTPGFRLPEVVTMAEYREVVEGLRKAGSRFAARALDGLERFLPHLRVRQVFETAATSAALAGLCRPRPSCLETFRRVVRWCLRTDYGTRAPTPGAPALLRG